MNTKTYINMHALSKAVKEKQELLRVTNEELTTAIGFTFSEHHIPSSLVLTRLLDELHISFEEITETKEEKNVFQNLLNEANTPEETRWMNQMIQMMLCIRKHQNLRTSS